MSYAICVPSIQCAPKFSSVFGLKIIRGLPRKTIFIAQFFLLLLLTIGSAIAAYAPPIGIPAPGFGIDEVPPPRPSSWDAEIPGYYYIDQANGSASQVYGTPASPRRYLPDPITAGSYIELHGSYNNTRGGVTWINGNGNNDPWVANVSGPVWVVGESMANAPVFTRRTVVIGSYVYIDTIKVESGGKLQIGSSSAGRHANHMMVRNSDLTGTVDDRSTLLTAAGRDDGGSIVNNIIFYNNKVHDTGNVNDITADIDAHGIAVGGAYHVWILNNEVYNTIGTGIYFNGKAQAPINTHHLYAGSNLVYNVRQAGIGVKWASDIIISQNKIHDVIESRGLFEISASPSKCIGFQYGPQRIWIIYNEISNCSYGIYGGSTSSTRDWYVYAIGNIIYDIHAPSSTSYDGTNAWSEAGIMMQGGTYRYIINNTLYNVDAGINGPSVGTSYYLHNNIVSNITQPTGNHIFIDNGQSASQSTLNNSLFYNPNDGVRIRWGNTTSDNTADFFAATGQCAKCYETDPQLLSTTKYRLKPSSNSDAIDNGAVNEVYDTFETRYGLNITVDYLGKNRPQGFGWDIGAHENLPSSPPRKTTLNVR
ncbi:MAG: right-handed parallel beta-helix repeat-containing protein [Gammaproteobacteria bacterium]|nr:right-handed parallel beta-helix repeat-containing protein [Gammaproteobacteria bacterium]